MICYAMLCHAMLRYAMLRYAVLCYAMLSCDMLWSRTLQHHSAAAQTSRGQAELSQFLDEDLDVQAPSHIPHAQG